MSANRSSGEGPGSQVGEGGVRQEGRQPLEGPIASRLPLCAPGAQSCWGCWEVGAEFSSRCPLWRGRVYGTPASQLSPQRRIYTPPSISLGLRGCSLGNANWVSLAYCERRQAQAAGESLRAGGKCAVRHHSGEVCGTVGREPSVTGSCRQLLLPVCRGGDRTERATGFPHQAERTQQDWHRRKGRARALARQGLDKTRRHTPAS